MKLNAKYYFVYQNELYLIIFLKIRAIWRHKNKGFNSVIFVFNLVHNKQVLYCIWSLKYCNSYSSRSKQVTYHMNRYKIKLISGSPIHTAIDSRLSIFQYKCRFITAPYNLVSKFPIHTFLSRRSTSWGSCERHKWLAIDRAPPNDLFTWIRKGGVSDALVGLECQV